MAPSIRASEEAAARGVGPPNSYGGKQSAAVANSLHWPWSMILGAPRWAMGGNVRGFMRQTPPVRSRCGVARINPLCVKWHERAGVREKR